MADEYRIDGWHLDKRISVGHLVTTLTVIVAFASWMMKIEEKIAVSQAQINVNTGRIERMERMMDGHYLTIITKLDKLDQRLVDHMEESAERRMRDHAED
jgi:hypothetical protein